MKKKIMPILAVVLLVTMMPMTVMAADHCGVTGAAQIIKEGVECDYTSTYNHFYGILLNNTCRVTDYHDVTYYQCVICNTTWHTDSIYKSEHSACGA